MADGSSEGRRAMLDDAATATATATATTSTHVEGANDATATATATTVAMKTLPEAKLRELFECPLCLAVLRNPITTFCGHSFCDACLTRALKTAQVCPLCRAPCYLDMGFGLFGSGRRACNVTLEKAIQTLLPAESAANAADGAAGPGNASGATDKIGDGPDGSGQLGLFVLDDAYFGAPGRTVLLRVFEPRYLLLVSRCLSEGCRFGILPGWSARRGVVVRVDRARETHNRLQVFVEGTIESRFEIASGEVLREEPGTGGLYYAHARVVRDLPLTRDEDPAPLAARAHALVTMLASQLRPAQRQQLESVLGSTGGRPPSPHDPADLSFWLLSALAWPSSGTRSDVLFSPSVAHRLREAIRLLETPRSGPEAYFDALAPKPADAFPLSWNIFWVVGLAFCVVFLGFD